MTHTTIPPRNNCPVSSSSPRINASVGFESGRRYFRKQSVLPAYGLASAASDYSAKRKKIYIAPDACVLLMPGTLERAAIEELLAGEADVKKGHLTISEKIKSALHKGSDAYTVYGVATGEIFTEEIELDTGIGKNAIERSDTGENIAVGKEYRNLKLLKNELEIKFRDFACKVYKMRIG